MSRFGAGRGSDLPHQAPRRVLVGLFRDMAFENSSSSTSLPSSANRRA